jgi:hypothetical protein
MANYRRSVMPPTQFGGLVPPVIKRLLIANGVLFVVYFLAVQLEIEPLIQLFRALSLIPLGSCWGDLAAGNLPVPAQPVWF